MDRDVVVPVMSVPAGVLRRALADRFFCSLPDDARWVTDRELLNSPTPYLQHCRSLGTVTHLTTSHVRA